LKNEKKIKKFKDRSEANCHKAGVGTGVSQAIFCSGRFSIKKCVKKDVISYDKAKFEKGPKWANNSKH
jgi:hypothetical protein